MAVNCRYPKLHLTASRSQNAIGIKVGYILKAQLVGILWKQGICLLSRNVYYSS